MKKYRIIDADSHIEEVPEIWDHLDANRMDHYYHADTGNARGGYMPKKRPPEYLREGRLFFTCEAEETSLPQVLELLGADQMMASADIPHGEARERSMDIIRERPDLSETAKKKILGENAARFYGV